MIFSYVMILIVMIVTINKILIFYIKILLVLCLLLLTNVFLVKLNHSVAEAFLDGKNLLLLYVINQSFEGKYEETVNHPKMALYLL